MKKLVFGIVIVLVIVFGIFIFLNDSNEDEFFGNDTSQTGRNSGVSLEAEKYIMQGFGSFEPVDSVERIDFDCRGEEYNVFCNMDKYSYSYSGTEFILTFKVLTPEDIVTRNSLKDYIAKESDFLVNSFNEANLKFVVMNDQEISVYDTNDMIYNNPFYFWISGSNVVKVTFSAYEEESVDRVELNNLLGAFMDKYPSDL